MFFKKTAFTLKECSIKEVRPNLDLSKYDGFISLGCVIKGQTPHFTFISKSSIDAIMNLSVKSKKPIGNGILTCLNYKQALSRSNPKQKDKGGEAAKAMISVLKL